MITCCGGARVGDDGPVGLHVLSWHTCQSRAGSMGEGSSRQRQCSYRSNRHEANQNPHGCCIHDHERMVLQRRASNPLLPYGSWWPLNVCVAQMTLERALSKEGISPFSRSLTCGPLR